MQLDDVGDPPPDARGDDPAGSLDHMLDGYAVLRAVRDGSGEIIDFEWAYINAVGAATYGRPAEHIIGRRLRSIVPRITENGVFDERCIVVETGDPIMRARVDYGESGSPGDFDARVWKHGDGYAIVWRDVADAAAAQAAARESGERLRGMVEHLPDAVSVFEAVRLEGAIVDFRCAYANAAAALMAGRSVDDLRGASLLGVLPEHGPGAMFDTYVGVVETGEPFVAETLWSEDLWGGRRPADRRSFHVRATKAGDGLVVVTRDVTNVRESAERDS
jgi:PAS domain-containing protein